MSTVSAAEPEVARTPRRRRGAIDRDQVVAAALDLVDRDGLDALSIRRLADRLDMEPMSIYKRVADKEDLLAGIAEQVWTEVAVAAPPIDEWAGWLRSLGSAVRSAIREHPNVVPVLVSIQVFPLPMLELVATQLERDTPGWPTRADAISAICAVTAFALGCAVAETSYCEPDATERQRLRRIARALPPDTPDRLIDTALDVCGCNADTMFTQGLDLILRGCEPDKRNTKR